MRCGFREFVLPLMLCASVILPVGCEEGPDEDYNGEWRGRTSNGGTVVFTVEGDEVTAFEMRDPGGSSLRLLESVAINGNSFSVEDDGGVLGMDEAELEGTFDSATHCTGSYSFEKLWMTHSGTYDATRQ
jgi:hypothetical protein